MRVRGPRQIFMQPTKLRVFTQLCGGPLTLLHFRICYPCPGDSIDLVGSVDSCTPEYVYIVPRTGLVYIVPRTGLVYIVPRTGLVQKCTEFHTASVRTDIRSRECSRDALDNCWLFFCIVPRVAGVCLARAEPPCVPLPLSSCGGSSDPVRRAGLHTGGVRRRAQVDCAGAAAYARALARVAPPLVPSRGAGGSHHPPPPPRSV
jgi:hypothetical protein